MASCFLIWYFLMLLRASPGVARLWAFKFLEFFFFFSCYLSIQHFCSFCSHVLLLLHPFVGLSSCILHLLVGSIFFHYFGRSAFVSIAWPCPETFKVSLLLLLSFYLFLPVVLSDFCLQLIFRILLFHLAPLAVSLFILLAAFSIQVLYFCSDFSEGDPSFHWLVLLLHRLIH